MIESASEDTIEVIFERAIEFENKAAHIFRDLSKLFSHIQEISFFWLELAEDEIQHANILQNVRKSLTSEHLLCPCDKEMSVKIDITQRMLTDVSTALIKNLDDAYELAHDLEFSEVNTIFKLLSTKFVHSEERKNFVVSEIKKHQKKLVDFSHNFGDRDWRKGISIHHVETD